MVCSPDVGCCCVKPQSQCAAVLYMDVLRWCDKLADGHDASIPQPTLQQVLHLWTEHAAHSLHCG